ncbi:ArsR/SmtB family transcription factor [Lapidilactobacillus bayanensis]|uniref:ArsR/SmtB family transcription factor n=1 Tax=Lapidilactobacillus bayanensis TaxID=2485998 RepID=UPI000F780125|nr:metalloregulator ArsR/SmtB family transcription factor [Lapidilactobacillus bayanensis]
MNNCCPDVPQLTDRDLATISQAEQISQLFKILANPTRLRIIHALAKAQSLSVNALAEQIQMKTQAVSNQLQKLVAENIVQSKRDGTFIYYQIKDNCTALLLQRAWCLAEDTGLLVKMTATGAIDE